MSDITTNEARKVVAQFMFEAGVEAMPDDRFENCAKLVSDITQSNKTRSKALADCYMMARRQLTRLRYHNSEDVETRAAWEHVVRFCESAGEKSTMLRDAIPTEIQNG